ncbi:hypothetical protein L7F22_060743 [Adiantum nelumboides]|nr:hypothetical protein [Adiantum nelumboides]
MLEQQQNTNGKDASCVYKTCIPHLVVEAPHAADAIAFYKRPLELRWLQRPSASSWKTRKCLSFFTLISSLALLRLCYVTRSKNLGQKSLSHQSWHMHYGKVMDPFGVTWSFGTPLKELQPKVSSVSYQLQEIYGIELSIVKGGIDSNNDYGKECVMCLAEQRDTI